MRVSVLIRIALLCIRDNGSPDNILKNGLYLLHYRTHNPKVVGLNPADATNVRPSLAGTWLKAYGALPDYDLRDKFEQDIALPIFDLGGIQQCPLCLYLHGVLEAELARLEPRFNRGLGHQKTNQIVG